MALLKAVFYLLIPIYFTFEKLIGEAAPVNKSFLTFGRKLEPAIFKASTKSSGESTLFPSTRACLVSFFVCYLKF